MTKPLAKPADRGARKAKPSAKPTVATAKAVASAAKPAARPATNKVSTTNKASTTSKVSTTSKPSTTAPRTAPSDHKASRPAPASAQLAAAAAKNAATGGGAGASKSAGGHKGALPAAKQAKPSPTAAAKPAATTKSASKPLAAAKASSTPRKAATGGGLAVQGTVDVDAEATQPTAAEALAAAAASTAASKAPASKRPGVASKLSGLLTGDEGENDRDEDDLDDDDDDEDDHEGGDAKLSIGGLVEPANKMSFSAGSKAGSAGNGSLGLEAANRAFRDDPMLDRRIIEGMLDDKDGFLDDMHSEGFGREAVVRRAAELGLSEALIRQVKGVAADLAGERPGKRPTPTSLGARTCLQCDRVFFSSGPGNRLCTRCRGGDAGLAQL